MKLILYTVLLPPLLLTSNSCATLSYYQQSIAGHMEVMRNSRPILEILRDDNVAAPLKARLQQAVKIRRYASDVLLLPQNDSYESYADLGRRYVVWNVVAAPEFSLEPLRRCYLIVGCLSYRGYFSREAADTHADELRSQGYDVHVAGVTAYSTLGWFSDPVINTMLFNDDVFLARVIMHELAHQLLYVPDDTEFNESFADMVAEYGIIRWLKDNGRVSDITAFEQTLAVEKGFNQLVLQYKRNLEEVYQSPGTPAELRLRKQETFAAMYRDYERLLASNPAYEDYREWFSSGLNNAKLALVITYKDLVPGFHALLSRNQFNLRRFYQTVDKLSGCGKEERRKFLASNLTDADC